MSGAKVSKTTGGLGAVDSRDFREQVASWLVSLARAARAEQAVVDAELDTSRLFCTRLCSYSHHFGSMSRMKRPPSSMVCLARANSFVDVCERTHSSAVSVISSEWLRLSERCAVSFLLLRHRWCLWGPRKKGFPVLQSLLLSVSLCQRRVQARPLVKPAVRLPPVDVTSVEGALSLLLSPLAQCCSSMVFSVWRQLICVAPCRQD